MGKKDNKKSKAKENSKEKLKSPLKSKAKEKVNVKEKDKKKTKSPPAPAKKKVAVAVKSKPAKKIHAQPVKAPAKIVTKEKAPAGKPAAKPIGPVGKVAAKPVAKTHVDLKNKKNVSAPINTKPVSQTSSKNKTQLLSEKSKKDRSKTKIVTKEKEKEKNPKGPEVDHDELDVDDIKVVSKKEKAAFHFTEKMKKDVEQIEEKIKEQFLNLKEYFQWKDIEEAILTMDIFLPKSDECMERSCENIRTSGPYCRYHYIYNWKQLNRKKEILKEGKLQNYIEELVSKYPAQYIQMLIDDLSDDREFNKVLAELNISDTELEIEEIEDVVDEEADDMDFEPRSIDSFKAGYEEE